MSMSFTAQERTALLACKGVGPKVIERLEQMGFSALAQLREASVDDIVARGGARRINVLEKQSSGKSC
jgi:nucleotidyltransferase/DNA polymerase involved in DNA repair